MYQRTPYVKKRYLRKCKTLFILTCMGAPPARAYPSEIIYCSIVKYWWFLMLLFSILPLNIIWIYFWSNSAQNFLICVLEMHEFEVFLRNIKICSHGGLFAMHKKKSTVKSSPFLLGKNFVIFNVYGKIFWQTFSKKKYYSDVCKRRRGRFTFLTFPSPDNIFINNFWNISQHMLETITF